MRARSPVLAWALIAFGLAMALATVLFLALDSGGVAAESQFGSTGLLGAVTILLPGATFFAVGGLLSVRRSRNSVGWICLAIGLVWLLIAAQGAGTDWAIHSGRVAMANWVGVLGALWVPALGLMATHLPLRLPDGRLPSPRWRWFSRVCTAVIVLVAVGIGTTPGPVNGSPGTENPLASEALQVLEPSFVLFLFTFIGAMASLVVRYRRTEGPERLQIRVIAFGGVLFLLVFIGSLAPLIGLAPEGGELERALQSLALLFYNAIPLAIAIAVFRYRLYDIDLVINRTLVYGGLTATLAVAYVGSVLLLQFALDPLTERSELAVAGSTLTVAALFRPARARIQSWVDRRFYRRRYDAARTLARFNSGLRDEVDLDSLGAELQSVVRETMQPAYVGLWLRPGATDGARG